MFGPGAGEIAPEAMSVWAPEYELASVWREIVYVTAAADGATTVTRTNSAVASTMNRFLRKTLVGHSPWIFNHAWVENSLPGNPLDEPDPGPRHLCATARRASKAIQPRQLFQPSASERGGRTTESAARGMVIYWYTIIPNGKLWNRPL